MNLKAMEPHGRALRAFFDGDINAQLIIRRDDGEEVPVPVSHFFRDASESTPIDKAALDQCRGHVLDVGSGTGIHSLILQERGLRVTSIDIIPQAVEIMRQRGVKDAQRENIFEFQGGPFDTILLMGHSIGIGGTSGDVVSFVSLLCPHRHHRSISGKVGT